MKLITLLHFYQPHNQQKDILDRIVAESYRPLISGMIEDERRRCVVNISGVLCQQLLENDYVDLVESLKLLLNRGQIEIVGSSMYHAFLPLLPKSEVIRQVEQNHSMLKDIFGSSLKKVGFFSPEMAISIELIAQIKDLGYNWIAVPELASSDDSFSNCIFYREKNSDMTVFFRDKRLSSLILSSVVKTSNELIQEITDIINDHYAFVVMDAETFGHHRIGHEKFLFDVLDNPSFKPSTISELLMDSLESKAVEIRSCTWTNEEQDFWIDKDKEQNKEPNSFVLWHDKENPIHNLQWELTNFVIDTVTSYKDKDSLEWKSARGNLDKAIASDQYWWASAKPWWSLEMIESGAFSLKSIVLNLPLDSAIKSKAEEYYRKILDQAFEWQRTGYIRKKHLENSATFMHRPFKDRTHHEWYNQIILEFEDEMTKASAAKNYEKAIKWRDALIKLKLGTDIYDVLHVVDELWSARSIPSVKPFFEHDFNEFSDFAKDMFLGFTTKDEFEAWKQTKEQKHVK